MFHVKHGPMRTLFHVKHNRDWRRGVRLNG